MGLNALTSRESALLKGALESLLDEYVLRAKTATTEEERVAVEGELIHRFLFLVDPKLEPEEFAAGDVPVLEDIVEGLDFVYDKYRMSQMRLQMLVQRFVEYHNTREITLTELTGRLKRIRQKRAALGLWDNTSAYVLAEHFFNHDWLSQDLISLPACDVVSGQGCMTLPVDVEDKIVIKNVVIGAGSNGSPGNSNVEVSLATSDPNNIHDGNVNTWFEYERLDSGPCELNLKVQLERPQIVNQLRLLPVNLGYSYSFEIVDVLLTTSNNESKSIRDLIGTVLPKDFWVVDPLSSSKGWHAVFLPVMAQSIIIKTRQRSPMNVEVATNDNRVVDRARFAVAIKSLDVSRRKYLTEGSMASVQRELFETLYAGVPHVDVYPPSQSLYDLALETSLDGGGIWLRSETWGGGEADTFILDNDTSLVWRATMGRKTEAFARLKDLVETTTEVRNVDSMLRTGSRFQSPALFALDEKPEQDEVFVMQTQLARRGNRYKTVYLGEGKGTDISFDIPVEFFGHVDPEELRIYVNGRPYTYQADNAAVSAGEWALSDDFRQIEIGSGLGAGSIVRLGFDGEAMFFTERADGFVHETAMLFDPDKSRISIRSLPRAGKRASFLVPRTQTVVKLPYQLIEDNSLVLQSANSIVYTEVFTRADVLATSNSYMFNYAKGIMWLNAATGEDQLRLSFKHHTPKQLTESDFEVLYDGLVPQSLLIKQEAFEALQVSDTLNGAAVKRYDPVLEDYSARVSPFPPSTTNAAGLDYNYLVQGTFVAPDDLLQNGLEPKEVAYIDGKTEFLGLIAMNNEKTVEIEPSLGLLQFTLSAGALVYYGYDVIFSDSSVFIAEKPTMVTGTSTVGDYYIDQETGVVTLRADVAMPAGIEISYYYRNPEFKPDDKFSVDYRNGYLYTHSDLDLTATVQYKVASYSVEYDIGASLEDYSYDSASNTVRVKTENLNKTNNLIKIFWEEQSADADLRELRDYFSPLVSTISYRFK